MAFNGTPTSATYGAGKFGSGSLSGGRIALPAGAVAPAASSTFTYECWVNMPAVPSALSIAYGLAGGTVSIGYMGIDTSGRAIINAAAGNSSFTSTGSICDGNWHHLALVANGAGCVAYVDGVSIGTSATVQNTSAGSTAVIGSLQSQGNFPFTNGLVDEVANWTTARYTGTFTPSSSAYTGTETGLVSLYHLDSTPNDSAGSAPVTATAYTLTGPSSGTVSVASGNFTVAASGTLSSAVVVTPSDGGNGGTFSPTTVTLAAGTNSAGTFTYTPASTGAKSISTTNNGSLTNPSAVTYTSNAAAAASNIVAPNDGLTLYSPGNWNVTSTAATTINPGAYFSRFTSSPSVTLNFDVSNNTAPVSQIEYRIDGRDPWIMAPVASTVVCTMPSDTTADAYHLVEVRVKSTSETINRWNAPSNTAVKFTGFTFASGATSVLPAAAPGGKILVFGDSITEGVRTINSTASNDTDRNSAAMGWAYKLRDLLGVEVGVIGFGATGLNSGGSGSVPSFPSSWSMMYAGQARTPDTSMALIVWNEGTNDGSNNTVSAVTTVLNGMLAAYPTTPIAILRPFNGTAQAANLQAGIAACSAPSRVTYVDTAGFLTNAYGVDGINLHPTGPNNLALIAPKIAAALKPLLYPSTTAGGTSTPRFANTFH